MKNMDLVKTIKTTYKQYNKFNSPKSVFDKKYQQEIPENYIHTILYLIYGYFYTHYKKELFNADFRATEKTIIVQNYFDLKKVKTIKLNKKEEQFITDSIDRLFIYSPWFLINQIRMTTPYIKSYREKKIIPIEKEIVNSCFKKTD